MYIDPRHLEQVAAIVDHGTLQAAALAMRTSQSALSRLIASLEARLNVALFEHNTRPLLATEMGRRLADQGRAIRVARLRAAEEVSLGVGGMIGEVKIGAPPFMCARLVRDALSDFMRERPRTEITLTPGFYPKLEQAVLLGQIDIAVCPIRLVVAPRSDLMVESLFRNHLVVVCGDHHPLLRKPQITAVDLEQAQWIGHSRESMLRQDMESALASLGAIRLRFSFQSESVGAIFDMMRAHEFLTVLPRYSLPTSLEGFGLSLVPIDLETPRNMVGMLTRRDAADRPVLDALKRHLRHHARKVDNPAGLRRSD